MVELLPHQPEGCHASAIWLATSSTTRYASISARARPSAKKWPGPRAKRCILAITYWVPRGKKCASSCIFNINANLCLFTTNKIQPLLELSIRRLAFDPGPTSASTSCRRFRSPSGSWLWWQWLSGNRIALKSRGRDSTSWVCPVKMVVPCGAYTYFKSLYDPHTYGLCWSNFDPYTPGLQIGQGIQIASGTLLAATCHRSKLATRTWEACFCKKYLQNIPEGPGLVLTYFDYHITNSKLGKCRSRSRFRASRAAFSWSRKAFKKNK